MLTRVQENSKNEIKRTREQIESDLEETNWLFKTVRSTILPSNAFPIAIAAICKLNKVDPEMMNDIYAICIGWGLGTAHILIHLNKGKNRLEKELIEQK